MICRNRSPILTIYCLDVRVLIALIAISSYNVTCSHLSREQVTLYEENPINSHHIYGTRFFDVLIVVPGTYDD